MLSKSIDVKIKERYCPQQVEGEEGDCAETVEAAEQRGHAPVLHQALGGVLHQHEPVQGLKFVRLRTVK